MIGRITLVLDPKERQALYEASKADLRPVRDQARWLLVEALRKRGLLRTEVEWPAEQPAEVRQ